MPLVKHLTLQNFIILLIFMFPIGAVTVRHWLSGIFAVLCLNAIGYLIAGRKRVTSDLNTHEIRLLWFLLAHFLIFLITSFINDPTLQSKWHIGVEIRFLLAIPLYIMIRRIPCAAKALLWGCAAGIAVTTWQAVYETQFLHINYTQGIYGPLFTGPFTLLMGLLLLPGALVLTKNIILRLILWIISLASLYVVIINESRGTYVAMLLVPLIMILYATKGWKRITVIILTLITATTLFTTSGHISSRFSAAGNEIKRYFSTENKARLNSLGSADTRLEMLRSLKYFARDHALLGVGTGNYNKAIQDYIDQGLVNPAIGNHSHPHNAFANAFMLKGILGLTTTLLLIFYPLYVFIRVKGAGKHTAILGIIHMTSMFIHSMNEAATFNKGNFAATLILFLTCFYSWHLRTGTVEQPDNGNRQSSKKAEYPASFI
jgi:O-antigen ligase